jgi:hypothetical protein
VVRFFVTYDLARSKTGSVKDRMTELYKKNTKNIHKITTSTQKKKKYNLTLSIEM